VHTQFLVNYHWFMNMMSAAQEPLTQAYAQENNS